MVLDLSQNLGFANVTSGKFPCVTPDGQKFMAKQVRFATPTEYMRFQGIWLERHVSKQFPGHLLQDLAGNAYETKTCAASIIAVFTFLAINHRCKLLQQGGPRAAVEDEVETEDSDDLLPISLLWKPAEMDRDSDHDHDYEGNYNLGKVDGCDERDDVLNELFLSTPHSGTWGQETSQRPHLLLRAASDCFNPDSKLFQC